MVKIKKIESAERATEVAVAFLKRYYPFIQPLRATRQDNYWEIEVDVGAFKSRIARVKLDAGTGRIEEYSAPPISEIV